MRKINVGAGVQWYEEGWEVLDNGAGSYDEPWKHRGKAWETGLPSSAYDIVFSSHMLEHIPHFRVERTISEFNRILKTGGKVRILVPDMKKYAIAYVNGDKSYFAEFIHNQDHLGIGGSFLRMLISPGKQTIAINREWDEIFGGYAHLYAYDFDMLRILLEKWGFGEIQESKPGRSAIEELRPMQHLVHDGQKYDLRDSFVRESTFKKSERPWHFGGFDRDSDKQLAVEAAKVRNEPYGLDKEFEFNRRNRAMGPVDNVKLRLMRTVSAFVDAGFAVARKSGMLKFLKALR